MKIENLLVPQILSAIDCFCEHWTADLVLIGFNLLYHIVSCSSFKLTDAV